MSEIAKKTMPDDPRYALRCAADEIKAKLTEISLAGI
jgi:hypothetical protein